jgi:hypothetical protein
VASIEWNGYHDRIEGPMIANDREFHVATERIGRLQAQIARLRQVETNPANDRAAAGGFLAEIDRMQFEVREYLRLHPTELATTA